MTKLLPFVRVLVQVFMKRLELCDDKNAKEYLRYVNAQMMEGGFTMQQMFQGYVTDLYNL